MQIDLKLNLIKSESDIVLAAKSGPPIKNLNEKELSITATGLIFKIAVISGCTLPSNDNYINALESEFILFLKKKYPDLTSEEILTAFRMNANMELGEKIEKYGEIFSLDYVGKVLFYYMVNRRQTETRIREYLEKKERDELETNRHKELRFKINEQYKNYCNGLEYNFDDCYRQLSFDGAFEMGLSEIKNAEATTKYFSENPNDSFGNQIQHYYIKVKIGYVAEKLVLVDYFNELKKRNVPPYVETSDGMTLSLISFNYPTKKAELEF